MQKLRNLYVGLLTRSLKARWVVFVTAIVLFVFGLVILRFLGTELLPKMDSGTSFVSVETPSGSSLDETEAVIQQVEAIILAEPEVERVSTQIGFEPGMHSFGGGGVQGPTNAFVSITLTPRTERDETIWQIQDRIREKLTKIPNIQNYVVRESGATAKATTPASIVVSIRGADELVLDRLGDQVLKEVGNVSGVVNPYRSWRMDQRSIILSVDEERARELGLPPAAMSRELMQSLDGMKAGILRGLMGKDTPIRVRYSEQFRKDEQDVYAVRAISTSDGKVFPVGALVSGKEVKVQGLVTRENLEPTLQILALNQGRALNFVSADVEKAVSQITTPQGYTIRYEGENRDMAESRGEIMGALGIAILAIYLLLVAQFRSWTHPITVMMAIPLSLLGVSIALLIAGKSVSMPVMVGLILLVGIVVNNSIILIDFIRQRREAGIERQQAIVESVSARFRPIMMTSFSTIVGMIPLALEWALGAERFSPLAIAVIGGMTAATFLTMLVIPVLYDAFDELGSRVKKIF